MNSKKALTIAAHPFKRYATAVFAVTNHCNAQCGFCSIWQQDPVKHISIKDVQTALGKLHRLGIRYVQFTGGEPFLYKHLTTAISYASKIGILSTVVTNGSLISEEKAQMLRAADIGEVQISVDHYKRDIMERNRCIPNLFAKIRRSIQCLTSLGIPVSASTTISKLLDLGNDDYRKLLDFCQDLGFLGVYFGLPMQEMESTYSLGGNGHLVSYNDHELRDILDHLKRLKQEGYSIDNSRETLDIGLTNLSGGRSRYPCLAGYKTFYLDWNLNLYGCMKKDDIIAPILTLNTDQVSFTQTECEECLLSCMREPSIYFQGVKSIIPIFRLALKPRYVNIRTWNEERDDYVI